MADPTLLERIQPCLLDRLTDDEPDNPRESRTARVISPARYRDAVMRDLRWLFNTSSRLDPEELADFPEVARSVISYGIRDLCGRVSTSLDVSELERELTEAVLRFEPRILPESVRVRAISQANYNSPSVLSFEISAELWANPLPEHLFIKTEIDLETGHCRL
jgi:type VI secretion system protein ImpF